MEMAEEGPFLRRVIKERRWSARHMMRLLGGVIPIMDVLETFIHRGIPLHRDKALCRRDRAAAGSEDFRTHSTQQ